ncbi:MAG: DUF3365 domain-containing protein [Planctomycetes bacterium]|nr:DUF3365 domain-containing protein [Planctomycetota bacterium]
MRRPRTVAVSALLLAAACASTSGSRQAWTPLEAPALDAAQQAQLERARGAALQMKDTLLQALSAELARGGPADAIAVCKERAPAVAQEVGEALGLRIGRTAQRLRNARNQAPAWAAPLLADAPAAPRFAVADDGTLGVTLPITLQAQCLGCHGDPATMLPAVRDALAASYPDDRATGFAEGDLRGWFWVEVPAARE